MRLRTLTFAAALAVGCGAETPQSSDSSVDAADDTFTALARDLFSATSPGKCQDARCHGGPTGAGGLAMGNDARGVYDGLTSYASKVYKPARVVEPVPGGDARPTSSLVKIIGPRPPGSMPTLRAELGNRRLNEEEVARVEAWLARGAPFD